MTRCAGLGCGRMGKRMWSVVIALAIAGVIVYRIRTVSDRQKNAELRDRIFGESSEKEDPCHFGDSGDWVYKTMVQEDGEQGCKCNSDNCCVCY